MPFPCFLQELIPQFSLLYPSKAWRLCLCCPLHTLEKMALPFGLVILPQNAIVWSFPGPPHHLHLLNSGINSEKSRVCVPHLSQGSPGKYINQVRSITNDHQKSQWQTTKAFFLPQTFMNWRELGSWCRLSSAGLGSNVWAGFRDPPHNLYFAWPALTWGMFFLWQNTRAQKGKSKLTSVLQASVHITSTNPTSAKANH